jgi:hypothetical protein
MPPGSAAPTAQIIWCGFRRHAVGIALVTSADFGDSPAVRSVGLSASPRFAVATPSADVSAPMRRAGRSNPRDRSGSGYSLEPLLFHLRRARHPAPHPDQVTICSVDSPSPPLRSSVRTPDHDAGGRTQVSRGCRCLRHRRQRPGVRCSGAGAVRCIRGVGRGRSSWGDLGGPAVEALGGPALAHADAVRRSWSWLQTSTPWSVSVGPPRASSMVWWISHQPAGAGQFEKVQPPSRAVNARRCFSKPRENGHGDQARNLLRSCRAWDDCGRCVRSPQSAAGGRSWRSSERS